MNTQIYADLDQIVFEGRAKEYGAYHIRKRYNRVLTRASLIAFLLFLAVTALPKVVTWIMPKHIAVVSDIPTPTMTEYDLKNPIDKPEPVVSIPQPPQPPVRTVELLIPVPTHEQNLEDERTIANVTDFDSAAVGLVTSNGDPTDNYNWETIGNCPTCPVSEELFVEELPKDTLPGSEVFVVLEKEPQPVNMEELRKAIGYPPMAVEAEIEGKVIVRVLVDKHGDYMKHKILKNPHSILTNAVVQKIHMLKMTPGIQAGKPIAVWVTLPLDFQLLK